MKHKYNYTILFIFALAFLFSMSSCRRGPSCPAYQSVYDAQAKTDKENKKDIEKKKKDELGGGKKKRKKAYNLFPKGMR